LTDDFVIRPGRASVLWNGNARSVKVRVASDVAVSIELRDASGAIRAAVPSFDHEVSLQLNEKRSLRLVVTNASGTRKARGNVEVKCG
jgi:hypothetical protein